MFTFINIRMPLESIYYGAPNLNWILPFWMFRFLIRGKCLLQFTAVFSSN